MESSLESEQGAFNAGIEYLKTLIVIERTIDTAFVDNDFNKLNTLLDVLWIEMFEWFNDDEREIHDKKRKEQKKAHNILIQAKKTNKISIPNNIIDTYIERYIHLKLTIHKKGLRMPKKDDPAHALGGKSY